jgi:beta-glucanase (GH16 family)
VRRRGALLAAAAVVAVGALAGRSSARAVSPPPAAADTLFFDDFSGPALDRTRWNVRVSGPIYNDEQQAYVDAPSTAYIVTGREAAGAEGGALVIQARHQPGVVTSEGKRFDFVSARLDTRDRFAFAYGTAAARMKLPAGTGLWPAFWALGAGEWPATGEIDIMENVGEADWSSVALHGPGYSGETPLVNRWYFPPGESSTGWHVYAVDWTPAGFVFRVDGRVIYRASRAMVEHYGRWAYDNPKYLILNLALGGAYPLKTNGVRRPYPGLPDSTVRRIRAGEARVLVDWVRVTRP